MDDLKATLSKPDAEVKLVNLPRTIKEIEQDEPLLADNKQRFVLFPIKYHEVSTPADA